MKTYDNASRTKRIWWDRYEKTWVLQTLDADGNQIGNAEYCYARQTAFAWLAI
jgi:hypothetical protein